MIYGMGKHYIGPAGPVCQPTVSLSASFQKNWLPHGLVRVRSHLMGRIGLGVRVSASFQKMPTSWGLGPRLVADRADVVFTHALNFANWM